MTQKLRDWIENNKHKLKNEFLSRNKNAIDWLEQNPSLVDIDQLKNNPNAAHLIKKYKYKNKYNHIRSKVVYAPLYDSPPSPLNFNNLIYSNDQYVNNTFEKINWDQPSYNTVYLNDFDLKEKKYWTRLSLSSDLCDIEILKNNKDKINWEMFSLNPAIFELDYDALKKRCDLYKKELIQKALYLSHIKK
jgi:hypothetical protein